MTETEETDIALLKESLRLMITGDQPESKVPTLEAGQIRVIT